MDKLKTVNSSKGGKSRLYYCKNTENNLKVRVNIYKMFHKLLFYFTSNLKIFWERKIGERYCKKTTFNSSENIKFENT